MFGIKAINLFCKYFLSHSIEKFRRGTFLRFTNFQVSKVFVDRRGVGEGDVVNNFCNKFFFSVSKIFVRVLFCAVFQKKLVAKIFMKKRKGRGLITIFCRNCFVSQNKNISQGNPPVCH